MNTRNYVYCDNGQCQKKFRLTSPNDLVGTVQVDTEGNEVGEREVIFACPECQRKYVIVLDDGMEFL